VEYLNDPRPDQYLYYKQLVQHLKSRDNIYPRQLEIHLPADHRSSCNLNCPHCAGRWFDKSLGTWEVDALSLLLQLKGAVPYHIYGGAYTEPVMNPYLLTFIAMTKRFNNHFGIHTNGTQLAGLQKLNGFLSELNRLSTDDTDYLSISIDAGNPVSWCRTKGTKQTSLFYDIIKGIELAASMFNDNSHALRLCYLISPASGDDENFKSIVEIARKYHVHSLRFSIPFANYNITFNNVRKYKRNIEQKYNSVYRDMLRPYLSKSKDERPYIFYTGPEFTDIDRYTFDKCYYSLYQITLGADGHIYRCSTVATPTGQQCRLGRITDDKDEFDRIVEYSQHTDWDCSQLCFKHNLRCNRMGLEINTVLNS